MNASNLVQKLWNYCNVLRDDGMSYGDYVEQLTYLLFLKMADERSRPPYNHDSPVPAKYAWPTLLALSGDALFDHYRHILDELGKRKGTLGLIFGKAQNKFQDPAKLTRFLFMAHNYIVHDNRNLTRDQQRHLRDDAFTGWELVQATARVCAMNLMLHGIGSEARVPLRVADALAADPGERYQVVLANPPFGKKSSTVIVGEDGLTTTEKDIIERDDFWATTSNKQLNFVQHIKTLLDIHGRAAVVVPDNVLFEGGAGETIRRKLLHECEVHTLLRLPTGLFYAQGVKANVLFFDKRPASETPWTKALWIYDLRTNQHFTLKTNPLRTADLKEFVRLYNPANRNLRAPTWSAQNPDGRWRAYDYAELAARDKASLDIFWLRDEALADSDNLPPPELIAQEIVDDLEAALEQFRLIAADLNGAAT